MNHVIHRIRVRYSKEGKIRFVSHRDNARLFERACRKARLPVAYSQGFSPRPKLSFGLALSVAHESDSEFLDIELSEKIDISELASTLTGALPDGLIVDSVTWIEPGVDSLQEAVTSCTWRIEVTGASHDAVVTAVDRAIQADTLPIERIRKGKTRTDDVRPMIISLDVEGRTSGGTQLIAELGTRPAALRPSELIVALGVEGLREAWVRRTNQWTSTDGSRHEPVAPAPSNGHALERAS